MHPKSGQRLLLGVLLTAAVLLVFGQVGGHGFVEFDDPDYVTENPYVRRGLTLDGVRWAFTTDHMGHWHPLTWLSHMLDVEMFGVSPGPHHLVSVALHLVNSLLLFAFLTLATRATWPSFAVAALFALHPLRAESVAWIAERKDVLSTLFWMLTLLAYYGWVRHRTARWYVATAACLGLGLLAKPMLVTLPFVLLLLDFWPFGRIDATRRSGWSATRAVIAEKAPFLVLVAAISAVAYVTQQSSGAMAKLGELPISLRAANAVVSYVRYLGMAVWPANLAVLYPYDLGLPVWQAAVAGLALIAVSLVLLRAAPRRPYAIVGWFWYLGTMVPVIGFVQIGDQALADRYTYVPLIGIFIAVVWACREVVVRQRIPTPVTAAVSALIVATYAVLGWQQVGRWRDGETLLSHTVAVTRGNYLVHTNLGAVLADRGRYDEAVAHLQLALAVKPDYATAVHNLALIEWQRGQSDEAVELYRRAIAIDPDVSSTRSNLGLALTLLGRSEEAMVELEAAVRLDPTDARAHNNLGVALRGLGRIDEAMEHFRRAMEIRPDYADPYNNVAGQLAADGRLRQAERQYRRALELEPTLVEAHFNLGRLLHHSGRPQEAAVHLREAVRLDPHAVERRAALADALRAGGQPGEAVQIYRALLQEAPQRRETTLEIAQALTQAGQPEEAIPYFQTALAAAPDDAQVHNDLGVALFGLGRTDEAIARFERALELDPLLTDARTNLEFVGANRPPAAGNSP